MDYKYLTATDIASYYRLDCELALWKTFHEGHSSRISLDTNTPNMEREGFRGVMVSEGFSVSSKDALTLAILQKGEKWEDMRYRRLEDQDLLLRLSERDVFKSRVKEDKRKRFFVTGAQFEDRGLFKSEYVVRNQNPVHFGKFKPDLIEVNACDENGGIELRVIEVKASRNLNVCCGCLAC